MTSNTETQCALLSNAQLPSSTAVLANNDFGSAIVTVALSINISANGSVYSTSRCSSPVRVPTNQAVTSTTESFAPQSLKLNLSEAIANQRANGFNSQPCGYRIKTGASINMVTQKWFIGFVASGPGYGNSRRVFVC